MKGKKKSQVSCKCDDSDQLALFLSASSHRIGRFGAEGLRPQKRYETINGSHLVGYNEHVPPCRKVSKKCVVLYRKDESKD